MRDLDPIFLEKRIKKLEENGGGGDTDLKERLDAITILSTDERVVGKWIDGKDIYEKIVTVNNAVNNTNLLDASDIDTPVEIKGTCYAGRYNQWYNIPNVHETINAYYVNLLVDGNNLQFRCGSGFDYLDKVIAIIRYTKK